MVKRYELGFTAFDDPDMMENDNGEFVKWEDYKALLDKYNTPSHREVEQKDREYQYHMEVGL